MEAIIYILNSSLECRADYPSGPPRLSATCLCCWLSWWWHSSTTR